MVIKSVQTGRTADAALSFIAASSQLVRLNNSTQKVLDIGFGQQRARGRYADGKRGLLNG